jgi:membrane-bound lytic murein transglycosylase MltF
MKLRALGVVRFSTTAFACVLLSAPPCLSNTTQPGIPSRPPFPSGKLSLPPPSRHWTGDFDVMSRHRRIRALVAYSHSGFFYDKGRLRGIYYEALEQFQRFVNQKLKPDKPEKRIKVTFLPLPPDQLEAALLKGKGDLIAAGVRVTPARADRVSFSEPIITDARQIVVTDATVPQMQSLKDLSGKKVYVNSNSDFTDSLKTLNNSLRRSGKPGVTIKYLDARLGDEDMLEMVNADLIPATVAYGRVAKFWSQVYPNIRLHEHVVLATQGPLAWVMRPHSPRFKKIVDEFVETHRVGTSFGNTLLRRYLRDTKWVKDSTTSTEMQKFDRYYAYFKQYAAQFDFDYLMLAALGYQESQLNQNKRSPRGAVGIMQVIPKYAAASPIGVKNVTEAQGNIEAGAKILNHIADTYFDDPGLTPLERTLMVFASYNAGPTRIARLRKQAREQGLNPNEWFDNVEFAVARDVGQETVDYVSNIYKYYTAYRLTLAEAERLRNAKRSAGVK